jgi:hypothetical protein
MPTLKSDGEGSDAFRRSRIDIAPSIHRGRKISVKTVFHFF